MYCWCVLLFFISSVSFANNEFSTTQVEELQVSVQKIQYELEHIQDEVVTLLESLQNILTNIAINHLMAIKEADTSNVKQSKVHKTVNGQEIRKSADHEKDKVRFSPLGLLPATSSVAEERAIQPQASDNHKLIDNKNVVIASVKKQDMDVGNSIVPPVSDKYSTVRLGGKKEGLPIDRNMLANQDACEEPKAQQDVFLGKLHDMDVTVLEVYNDPQILYDQALNLMHQGQIMEAISGFKYFIQKFSHHELLPHVYFWLGNSYYLAHEYPAALHSFTYYLQRWPRHEKAPTILLNVFHIYTVLGEHTKAQECMQRLLDEYPHSRETELAKMQSNRNG